MPSANRVVYLTNLFPTREKPAFGTFVKASSDAIAALGREVTVIALPNFGQGAMAYARFYVHAFIQLLRHTGIVYVHYVSHSAPPAVFARLFNPKIQIVLHYHGSDAFPEAHEGWLRAFLKAISCRAANHLTCAVVAPSKAFLERLQRKFALKKVRVGVSPSGGVNPELFFNPFPPSHREFDLAFAGRMVPGKGALEAARVAASVLREHPQARATFIGEGPERTQVEATLSAAGVLDRITFMPLLSPGELSQVFRSTRILLFPSSRKGESLGLTWIEAGMCGAVPLILRNGTTETLVPDSLAASITLASLDDMIESASRLLDDRMQREAISSEICAFLKENYSRDQVAICLDRLFREVETYSEESS